MNFDLLIVGAGPAGLAAAIRAKQAAFEEKREIRVCVLEKGARVGAHILSGAMIDPVALTELLPDWRERGAPPCTELVEERFSWLGETSCHRVPGALRPPLMRNRGAYLLSLGELCAWLGEQAEALGVEIYPGFAAAEVLHGREGEALGVLSGDMGRNADGSEGPRFVPGAKIHASYTLIAEGARGFLTRALEQRFALRRGVSPQKYAIGLKELWRVPAEKHRPGLAWHTLGWPLDDATGGGSFLYHHGDGRLAIGLVVHLDYANPYLSPFDEFQRFKTHPHIRPLLAGGECLGYGARAIAEGGLQSLPELVFPGGALIGCCAGMVNVPRMKGVHNAMKSGMLAAEAVSSALARGRAHDRLDAYPDALRRSWVWRDLAAVRNVKPWLSRLGTLAGSSMGALEMWLAAPGLDTPWTLRHRQADRECLTPAAEARRIAYPRPDGRLAFDRSTALAHANIVHDKRQPGHLRLVNPRLDRSCHEAPEQRYCPAGVFEIEGEALRLHAQNCLHCKTCDIKDPSRNIVWTPPEGGSGPNYPGM
jgi:electron-transferring-flavoprotein dehydrogenase